MFKKMVLAGILFLLFSTLVSAEITPTPLPDLSLPPDQLPDLSLPDLSFGVSLFTGTLLPNDLLVELVANIPSNLKVNDKFWVDIYVTPNNNYLNYVYLKLTTSDATAATFTGFGKNGNLLADTVLVTYVDGTYYANNFAPKEVVALKRYKLGSLEMRILDLGKPFTINLDLANSKVNSYTQYNLIPSSTILVKLPKTVCVPRTSCTPGYSCGIQDNGCGGVISCGTCALGTFCAGNFCAAPELLLENPADSELCQLIVDIPANSDKMLLKTIGETLQGWGNVCLTNADCKAGYSCHTFYNKCTATELSVLSPIFTALKIWLGVKFQSF